MSLNEKIIQAFEAVTADDAKEDNIWVQPYKAPEDASAHQFVFFMKPEATDKGVKVKETLDLFTEALEKHEVQLNAVRVLGGPYLSRHNTIADHYGVIAVISKKGKEMISEDAKAALEDLNKDFGAPEDNILGAHQFLEKFPQFNAFSLNVLNDNLGASRLAPGTYAMKLKVFGDKYIVLNPFHPQQLVPFESAGRAIVVIEATTKRSWADLRNKICGQTDPTTAEEGSLRALLLKNYVSLGLQDCNRGANGCHTSAGPLEGLVELRRFFPDAAVEEFNFGKQLKEAGFTEEQIQDFLANKDFTFDGKTLSAFDGTEELDAVDAVEALKKAVA